LWIFTIKEIEHKSLIGDVKNLKVQVSRNIMIPMYLIKLFRRDPHGFD